MEPKDAADIEAVVEDRLAAVATNSGFGETVTVEWRGGNLSLPVVKMPVAMLYYNPATHRIRAQREVDPERNRSLTTDPFGEMAQSYLGMLLKNDPADPQRSDPAFENLKNDLSEHGQRDPGIITRSGVLINGNTRRAALLAAGHEHIRVGVLPSDASASDLQAVELALQLRKDHRRDYSYVNLLLAIDDRINAGRPVAEIMSDFRIKRSTFDRNVWILTLIREAIERSSFTDENGNKFSLTLYDFENEQGKLEELHRTYLKSKEKSPESAELVREQRLLGIAIGRSKTDLRLVNEDFAEKYATGFKTKLEPVEGDAEGTIGIPGTSIKVPSTAKTALPYKRLTDEALRSRAVVRSADKLDKGIDAAPAAGRLSEIESTYKRGLEVAERKSRVEKRKAAPSEKLSDANDFLLQAVEALNQAKATGTLVLDELDEPFQELRNQITAMARLLQREEPDADSAANWVIQASAL